MSLFASQRKVLDRIESTLRASDPRLIALFSMFGRLTRGEEMPRVEQLRQRWGLFLLRLRLRMAWLRRRLRTLFSRPRLRRAFPTRRGFAVIIPLTLMLTVVAMIAIARVTASAGCTAITTASNSMRHAAKSRLCRPPAPAPLFSGK